MTVNRREILTTAGAALLAASGKAGAVSAVGSGAQPLDPNPELGRFPTLADAMRAARFDPRRSEAFTTVFTADIHYGAGAPDDIRDRVVGVLGAVRPQVVTQG